MPNPRSFWRILTERGPLVALTVAVALLVGIAGPVSAQFFNLGNFGRPTPPQPIPEQRGGSGWFGNDFFQPFRQEAPRRHVREDFSKASAAEDRDAAAPAHDKTARSGSGVYEFRDDRWIELYSKKIEEMAGILKAKGVPVLWVGLPAVRGAKATSDMLFLDSLYRDAAGKAGITYVDVWDGFVDEAGRFLQRGPDFEGQPRKLRSDDGVFFTRAGARKLAHYVEREVTRLMAGRSAPIALPSEPATPDASAEPGKPAPRPLAGPILPLVASSVGTDQLLGGPGSRPAAVDALAARTLVKGEPLTAPAGRADDFAWPRREVGREQAKGETPSASVSQAGAAVEPGAPPKPKKPRPAQSTAPAPRDFFGNTQRPPPPPANVPRPPGNLGPSAWAPGFFGR